jgi:hypothetical protein
MAGLERFERLLYVDYQRYLSRVVPRNADEVLQRYRDAAAGKPLPASSDYGASRDEKFLIKLLGHVAEIRASYDGLLDAAAFLRRYPYKPQHRITQERFVRYHVEHFYQEIYILRERLYTFSKWLQRAYRNTPQAAVVGAVSTVIPKLFNEHTEHLTRVRGRHVHETRVDDAELRQMTLLEAVSGLQPRLQRLIRLRQRRHRIEAARWARDECKAVKIALDVVFSILLEVVSKEAAGLIYPAPMQTA